MAAGPPRERPFRNRRVAAAWFLLTFLFTVTVVLTLMNWQTSGAPILWLTAIGGIGCVAGIWRWFYERARAGKGRPGAGGR